MEKENKIIGYIENGIVIDHIPFGKVWEIAEILGINKEKKGRVSLGDGYESKKISKKGVLKIENISLNDYQLNLIALIAKDCSVSVITNGIIERKIKVEIPKVLRGVILCPNVGCISNDKLEKVIPIVYYEPFSGFRCHYCSREFNEDEIKFCKI